MHWLKLNPANKAGSHGKSHVIEIQGIAVSRDAVMRLVALAVVGVAALFALGFYTQWDTYLRFRYGGSFESSDPVFGVDVGFYVFRLPFYLLLQGSLVFLTVLAIVGVVAQYAYFKLLRLKGGRQIESWGNAAPHLSVLLFILAASLGWGYYLDRFDLLYSTMGVVYGVGYTADHVTLIALWVMIGVSAVACALLALNFFRPRSRAMAIGVGVYGALYAIGIVLVPALVQAFVVQPNELALETPYLKSYIEFTRKAYNLEIIKETSYPALEDLTPEVIARNQGTIQNIRLWDSRPLLQTYQQTQAIRLYYEFYNVDTDRYHLADGYHQVMLATRELSAELPAKARTWVNENLQFTHGEGVVMNFVSKITPGGFPEFLIKNVPPESSKDLNITQPAIYYGESMPGSRIVATGVKEFDYPKGNQNVYASYEGEGGIPLDSFGKRLLFAWTQADINILLTSYLKPESRIQIWRDVQERVSQIAPFLRLDADPYAVVSEGKQYWIQDAYTISDHFPYSNPHRTGYGDGLNYIRNSVKAVVDMYDGTVSFYVMDPHDPVLAVYRRAFPDVFKDLEGTLAGSKAPPALSSGPFRNPSGPIRELPHDRSSGLLQPRGSVGATAGEVRRQSGSDGALLHPDEASRKRPVGIPDYESFHAAKQGQHDRLAGRAMRFSRVRKNAVLRASEREADLRAKPDFSDDRSEHDDFATTDPLGSKRFRSNSREAGCDSDRELLPLRSPAVSQSRGDEFSPTQARHCGDRKQGRDGAYAGRSSERPVRFARSPADRRPRRRYAIRSWIKPGFSLRRFRKRSIRSSAC